MHKKKIHTKISENRVTHPKLLVSLSRATTIEPAPPPRPAHGAATFEDLRGHLHTTHSYQFLGIRNKRNLLSDMRRSNLLQGLEMRHNVAWHSGWMWIGEGATLQMQNSLRMLSETVVKWVRGTQRGGGAGGEGMAQWQC